jgi:hypothetical protein
MRYFFALLLLSLGCLNALTVTDTFGVNTEYSYEFLSAQPRSDFETVRVKDGVEKRNRWQGFSFNAWLMAHPVLDYSIIRFESADGYLVSLSRAEFDTLDCWLVFTEDGKPFDNNAMRIIFPQLRDMKWIRDVSRVVFEDFDPLGLPKQFSFLEERLSEAPLKEDPAPFVNTKGYYFSDLLPKSALTEQVPVVLYSRDGLKLALEYPRHLEGAILEVTDDGFNLKSPRIPGGMWIKDIIYIQINDFALISTANLDALIALNRVMDWKLSPEVRFILDKGGKREQLPLADLLANPGLLQGVKSFELIP